MLLFDVSMLQTVYSNSANSYINTMQRLTLALKFAVNIGMAISEADDLGVV